MIFPSLKTALKSAKKLIISLFRKETILAEEETVEFRRRVCKVCPFYSESLGQCKVCTCFVSAKTLLSTETCPKGFWEA